MFRWNLHCSELIPGGSSLLKKYFWNSKEETKLKILKSTHYIFMNGTQSVWVVYMYLWYGLRQVYT